MFASLAASDARLSESGCGAMKVSDEICTQPPSPPSSTPVSSTAPSPTPPSPGEEITKRAIRELLDVLPEDILSDLNAGTIDLKDSAFLDGLVDHISRLSLANPRAGQKILPKILKLKKLISRSLRESDPEVRVSATVARTTARIGRNDACPCGSGKKYKQCCLRKGQKG